MTTRVWTGTIAAAAAWLVLAAAAGANGEPAESSAGDPAETAVRAALQPYLEGHAAGCGVIMSAAFMEGARLTEVLAGELHVRDAEHYLAGLPGSAAGNEAERRRWIESVDVAGDMAIARVIRLHPRVRFVDYLVLHRVNGEWKIVHKAYHASIR
jgi:hypothetical protein